ncbi:unnamed protein product [Rotaria socialis]
MSNFDLLGSNHTTADNDSDDEEDVDIQALLQRQRASRQEALNRMTTAKNMVENKSMTGNNNTRSTGQLSTSEKHGNTSHNGSKLLHSNSEIFSYQNTNQKNIPKKIITISPLHHNED